MEQLFGTDGIRGVANHHPMTIEVAAAVGRAIAQTYCTSDARGIVVARDTRQSGDMLAYGLISGILAAGGDACPVGVAPTPAVSYLTAVSESVAGVMISASHNPYQDNGIKVFKGDGFKLDDAEERKLEAKINAPTKTSAPQLDSRRSIGQVVPWHQGPREYVRFLVECARNRDFLKGIKLVLDCSNGATYKVAKQLYSSFGAQVIEMFIDPDGFNINAGCGSQHPEKLSAAVVANQAHAGLAFDGDGDRLIAVDERGKVLTGDQILLACALDLKARGELHGNTVVTTVMSNLGLRQALQANQISHHMAAVGDRYVLEMMSSTGACVGGEDSGHMIFLNDHRTGDGMLTGIRLLEAVAARGCALSELRGLMQVHPQILINVSVNTKPPLDEYPSINKVVRAAEARLGDTGRVLLRYSGTSNKCRVMVEGPRRDLTEILAKKIAALVERELGPAS